MAQNRPPPAFQEYAANMMARTEYRVLSLMERGLLMTIRLECWVNIRMPADPSNLSKVLGVPLEQVKEALPAIAPFLKVMDGYLICPELEDYREYLNGIRDKKSQGGKLGAKMTNARRQSADSSENENRRAESGNLRVTRDSLVQPKLAQLSKTQSLVSGDVDQEWVVAYEGHLAGD
jgi:hypothetical protein